MERLIADAGFFIALGRSADSLHVGARRFAGRFKGQLVTASPIIVEACHPISPRARLSLLAAVGIRLAVVELPDRCYPDLAATIEKYADHDVDFADASLVWLAEQTGLRRILTVDVSDFSAFRLKNGKRFELVDWY